VLDFTAVKARHSQARTVCSPERDGNDSTEEPSGKRHAQDKREAELGKLSTALIHQRWNVLDKSNIKWQNRTSIRPSSIIKLHTSAPGVGEEKKDIKATRPHGPHGLQQIAM